MENVGTISIGIKAPIIKEGDNIVKTVVCSVLNSVKVEENDVIGITESAIARSAGLYVTVDEISEDITNKFGKNPTITLLNPIYSRNRFSLILRGIARASKKLKIVMPDYDEVGNPKGLNKATNVNITELYKSICKEEKCSCDILPKWDFDANTIYCGLHDYNEWGKNWKKESFPNRYTLADICSDKNPDYGLLGTNKANDETLKLFPTKKLADEICLEIKKSIKVITAKNVIVLVYGDGCFKDPYLGIWEFADPDTCPGYTDKELLNSSPEEIKLKALIDTNKDVSEEDLKESMKSIKETNKKAGIKGEMGTTPRKYKDLLASLMDLTSGSGDKGTPIILVQNYFKNYIS